MTITGLRQGSCRWAAALYRPPRYVTGGTVVDGKTTAPDEIRGPRIDGGESRRLGKGDVIIVPNGTPHWFKEVQGPVLYYVVKVR